MRWMIVLAVMLGGLSAARAETPCGPEAPCSVADGDYYLAFPAGWDGETPLPALVFYHGHRSSGLSVLNSASMRTAFSDHGYLLIAPNGALRPGTDIRAWPARPTSDGSRDDVAFTLAVLDDVAARVPLDQDRIAVAGFSAGGSMAHMMACYEGARFMGAISIAGALRRPIPDGLCPGGPVRILHFHGYADTQVPLEGRGIRDWHQGDVFETLDLMRRTDQCQTNPTSIDIGAEYWCRSWTGCGSSADIQFCLHDGGHGIPSGWAEMARDWLERGARES